MKKNNFEEWIINHCNQTIDFQIFPLDLIQTGGITNRFCILPIGASDKAKHTVFDIKGDTIELIQSEDNTAELLEHRLDIDTNPDEEAIDRIENLEDYLTLYASTLRLRVNSENQFYIHPESRSGATLTFAFSSNQTTLLKNEVTQKEEVAAQQ